VLGGDKFNLAGSKTGHRTLHLTRAGPNLGAGSGDVLGYDLRLGVLVQNEQHLRQLN